MLAPTSASRIASRMLATAGVFLMLIATSHAGVGDSCTDPVDHCGAPEANTGCCYSKSSCYLKDDCASYVAGCPFTNDGKKGEGLKCTPDKSPFKEVNCTAGVRTAQGIPIENPKVKCYESNNLICNVYKNKTFTHFTAQCKPDKISNRANAPALKLSMLLVASVMSLLLVSLLRL